MKNTLDNTENSHHDAKVQEIIEFLQWVFRKIEKGDTPEETVRMLLMKQAKIDNIKFDRNNANTLLEKDIAKIAHKNFPYGSKMPIGSQDRSSYETRKEAFIAGFKACCNYR